MTHKIARMCGVVLFAVLFSWLYHRAADLAVVSPVHWPLLLPRLVLEAVPATIGVATAGMLVFSPRKAKTLTYLLGLSVLQSVIIAAAVPGLQQDYHRTIHESRGTWHSTELTGERFP